MPSLTRLSTIGAVALTLFSSARGSAHDAVHSHAKRQNSAAIVGAADHKVVPRLELRQLQADTDAYNLFMLAMQDFQNAPHDSGPMSYFELAGVHGMPYGPWNGVQGSDPNGQTGWCHHATPTFITWHRPYIVAWEQAMLDHAQNVVNKFSGADKDRMQSALGRLRYPYVDFAVVPPSGSNSAVPTAMTDKTVTVNGPTGSQTIPNPLYSYNNFNPHQQGVFGGYGGGMWDQWGSTLRYPTSTSDVNAQSQDQKFVDAMNQNAAQIRAQVYRVLTACDQFLDISNDGAQHSNSNCNIDLESVHNGIHAIIGGGGHMTYNNWSGFDASFFMHHANIDRIFAMWQKLHPDAWMPATNSGPGASYAVKANTPIDGNSPLEPFRDASGTAYTSNSIRDIQKFYYTYPELADANLVETINNLYGSNAKPENVDKPKLPTSSSSSSSSTSSPAPTSSSSSSSAGASSGSSSSSESDSNSNSDKSNSLSPSKTSEIYSMLSSAFGPAATVLKNPEVSAAISSAMQAGATDAASFEKAIESAVSSAMKSGATGIPGLESGIGGMMSSIIGGAGKGASGPSSMISSIIGNLGSMLGDGAQSHPTGVSGIHPTGGLSGLMPSGISGGAFPTATGGAFPSMNSTLNGTSPIHSGTSPTDRTQDYYCHFVAERGGLGTTFNVYGFLGEAPSGGNPLEWMANKNYCGLWSNFAAMTKEKMSMSHLVSGSIVLTHCLQQKVSSGDLKSMDEKDVTPYLTKNLSWKTATGAGQEVQNSQVPGLTVGSIAQKIMPASNLGSLPTYGQGNIVPSITNGKDGGYQKGMQYNWWDVCKAN